MVVVALAARREGGLAFLRWGWGRERKWEDVEGVECIYSLEKLGRLKMGVLFELFFA